MLSTSLAAVAIALAILVAAQIFYSAGLITADGRNLCLTALLVWAAIAMTVFIFGVFAMLKGLF